MKKISRRVLKYGKGYVKETGRASRDGVFGKDRLQKAGYMTVNTLVGRSPSQ